MARHIYLCEECGSDNVQGSFWVDLNSTRDGKNGQRATLINESGDEYWCENCETHVKRLCLVDSRTRYCSDCKKTHEKPKEKTS